VEAHGLTRKQYKRLERPDWDKHSSLIGPFANHEEKILQIMPPGANVIKPFTNLPDKLECFSVARIYSTVQRLHIKP